MWDDERFQALSAPKPNAQSLWQRLLTGPELGCIPGLYPARLGGLAEALKWPLNATKKCWQEIADQRMAEADWAAGLVWVPNAIVHNTPQSTNTVVGWRLALRELPECELKRRAIESIRAFLAIKGEQWVKAFDMASSKSSPKASAMPSLKASAKPSRIQDQEQDTGTRSPEPEPVVVPVDSDRETACPMDLTDRADAVGIFPELSKHLGVPEVALREEARQFVTYWVIGKGMGKRRSHWMAKLRQRLVDRASEGKLPKVAEESISWPG